MQNQLEEKLLARDALERVNKVRKEHGNYTMRTLEGGASQLKFGYRRKEFEEYIQKMLNKDGKIRLIPLLLFNKHEARLGLFYHFLGLVSQLLLPVILQGMIQWMFNEDGSSLVGVGCLAALITFIVLKDYFTNIGAYYLRLTRCELENQLKVSEPALFVVDP